MTKHRALEVPIFASGKMIVTGHIGGCAWQRIKRCVTMFPGQTMLIKHARRELDVIDVYVLTYSSYYSQLP